MGFPAKGWVWGGFGAECMCAAGRHGQAAEDDTAVPQGILSGLYGNAVQYHPREKYFHIQYAGEYGDLP